MEDNLLSKLARMIGGNIPGTGISASAYYMGKKTEFGAKAKEDDKSIEKYLESSLMSQLDNIESLTEYQLASLATDLNTFFKADRYFRKGWVVEGYWTAYEKCGSEACLVLDVLSGW